MFLYENELINEISKSGRLYVLSKWYKSFSGKWVKKMHKRVIQIKGVFGTASSAENGPC